jgi:hypothetical protein
MSTVLITHEVDDVGHWVSSPKRNELFPTLGITHRTFVDATTSNLVGIVAEIPDLDVFREWLTTDAAGEAMTHDGVRPDTIRMFISS